MIRQVPVPDGSVELADEGSGRAVVVLLHGFTGSKASWAGLRSTLARKRRVVSIDLPGHGGTRVRPAAFSMAGAASSVAAALDALGVGPFSLVGYSMGGRLALYLALALRGRVEALVLESASPGIADPADRERRRAADEALAARIEVDGIESFVDSWERRPLFASLAKLPAARARRLRAERLANDPAGLATSLRAMGAGAQPWLGPHLGELAAPTLFITGEDDAKYAGIGRALARDLPRARLALVEGAGHAPHLERPEAFAALVTEFLEPRGGEP